MTVDHLTVGRVPSGALVQVGQRVEIAASPQIVLALRDADFGNAHRLAVTISDESAGTSAKAVDPSTVMSTSLPSISSRFPI